MAAIKFLLNVCAYTFSTGAYLSTSYMDEVAGVVGAGPGTPPTQECNLDSPSTSILGTLEARSQAQLTL